MFSSWNVCVWTASLVVCHVITGTTGVSLRTEESNPNRRAESQGRVSNTNSNRPYYWMCPEVQCPTLPARCQHIEYMVFEYDYEVRGRMVTVRCESCEYCLDAPQQTHRQTARHRRSHPHRHRTHTECNQLVCPSLPSACTDSRLTDILLGDEKCKRCPACYDNTVVNNT